MSHTIYAAKFEQTGDNSSTCTFFERERVSDQATGITCLQHQYFLRESLPSTWAFFCVCMRERERAHQTTGITCL